MNEKLSNYQKAARKRVEKELKADPNKYRTLGSQGGLAKVPKGFALLSPEQKKNISRQAYQAKMAKKLSPAN